MKNWYPEVISENKLNKKDPSQDTVQSHDTKLSNVQIFVREVVQNVYDSLNKEVHSKAILEIELLRLSGESKKNFLEAIQINTLVDHYKSVRQNQERKRRANILPDIDDYLKPENEIRLLYINDIDTYGLIGPEFESEILEEESLKSFIGLCRGTGENEKGGNESSGGTNGYGKSVLWRHSDLSLVFFYSELSTDYIDPSGLSHRKRLIGISRMADHLLNGKAYSGVVNFGTLVENSQNVRAVYDDEAEELAKEIGFEREPGRCGTSILIVGFQDLSDVNDKSDIETMAEFKAASEEYYWPCIDDEGIEIRFKSQEDGYELADPTTNAKIRPFLDIYRMYKSNDLNEGHVRTQKEFRIPKNVSLGYENDSENAKITLCASLYNENEARNFSLLNSIALIRGSKMVVKYEKLNVSLSGKNFHGIILGGTIISQTDEQKHLEKLLALSEPISHDGWNDNSNNLNSWRGSKVKIKQIKEAIFNEISRLTSPVEEPEGSAAPFLSNMFSFVHGENVDFGARNIRQSNIQIFPFIRDDESKGIGFRFDINVPAKKDFIVSGIPTKWKLDVRLGSTGESGSGILIPYKLKFEYYLLNGVRNELENDFANRINEEFAVSEDQENYTFFGESMSIEDFEIGYSKMSMFIETSVLI
jgi:hypothetical protein